MLESCAADDSPSNRLVMHAMPYLAHQVLHISITLYFMKSHLGMLKLFMELREMIGNILRKLHTYPRLPSIMAVVVWIAGMVIGALVTFPNHYNFRTYAYDLGYVLGMFENISRGEFLGTVYYPGEVPHIFYAAYILGLPFYWMGGLWGVMVYQWLAIGMGALGIYRYAQLKVGSLAWLSILHYWGMWGIYGALSYDVHPEILGSCLVPWIFYALETKKRILLYILVPIALFSKHTISIWLVFVSVFLYLYHRKDKIRKRYALFIAIGSLAGVLISFMINSFFEHELNSTSRFTTMYKYLWSDNPINPTYYANSLSEKVRFIMRNWYYIWVFLWESPHFSPETVGIKSEVYLSILITGGWTILLMPILIIPAIPVVLYKNLAHDYQVWGILYQYNMEYAVYIPLAFVIWLSSMSERKRIYLFVLTVFASHIWLLYLMRNTVSKWYERERMVWYSHEHYTSIYNYERIHEALATIPDTSYVTAVSRLLPHLKPQPGRHFHLGFGIPNAESIDKDSPVYIDPRTEYIVLLRSETNSWPVKIEDYYALIDYLTHSPRWRLVHDRDSLLIFRRYHTPNVSSSTG